MRVSEGEKVVTVAGAEHEEESEETAVPEETADAGSGAAEKTAEEAVSDAKTENEEASENDASESEE